MTRAWRIVKAKYSAAAFDGEGARLYGGRWNSPGTAMIYAADSPSLAALELLVGLEDAAFLSSFVLLSVDFPDPAIVDLKTDQLPADWRSYPAPPALARYGDAWIRAATSLALRVPSVVVPQQSNLLIHPKHPDFRSLVFGPPEPFHLDPRLLRRPRISAGPVAKRKIVGR